MKPAIIHRTTQAELTPSETLYTDSIDYLLGGALTLRNGKIDKYQFDEGYCQAERYTSTKDYFTFCYYDKDHLGNVRQVTELDGSRGGNVIQRNNYYPFGAEFCDGNANTSVQSRKYNGKEFDNMHGLNTYDYGARQYNPVTARWDRVDPLAHEYYGVSPYVYCANNPMRYIDLDGRWYWENNGNLHAEENDNTKTMADFLGTTQKNVIEILGRSNISVGKNGKINVKNLTDLSLNKSSLYVMKADKSGIVLESKSIESNPYIDGFNLPQSPTQTELAVAHYFLGNGEPADVGDKATALLLNTKEFKENLKATTTEIRESQDFAVDMTDLVFHIGRTPVNYTVHHGTKSSHVDFRLFQNKKGVMDSFSDPLDVRIELPGGTKYNYKLRTVTYYFKPVK